MGHYIVLSISQVALVIKNPSANAGDIRNVDSVPGSGRSPENEMATQSSVLAWRMPGTGEPVEVPRPYKDRWYHSQVSTRRKDGGRNLLFTHT